MFLIGEEYSLICVLLLINHLILFTCVLTSFDMCVHQNSEMLTSESSHSVDKFRTYSSGMWGIGCCLTQLWEPKDCPEWSSQWSPETVVPKCSSS